METLDVELKKWIENNEYIKKYEIDLVQYENDFIQYENDMADLFMPW